MGIAYHGSSTQNLKHLEPRRSTHGTYVYATDNKALALHFGKRCGDDMTYFLGHFDNSEDEPYELIECIPGAFEKMYSNSCSIYSFSDETFKDIKTGFREIVSEVGVDVIDEEYYDNLFEALFKLEEEGLIKIYRYPDKPKALPSIGAYALNKIRRYDSVSPGGLSKGDFERLLYLHPYLLNDINDLCSELGYKYHFKKTDVIRVFNEKVKRQLHNVDMEYYIDCSYEAIASAYPELVDVIEPLYTKFRVEFEKKQKNNVFRL